MKSCRPHPKRWFFLFTPLERNKAGERGFRAGPGGMGLEEEGALVCPSAPTLFCTLRSPAPCTLLPWPTPTGGRELLGAELGIFLMPPALIPKAVVQPALGGGGCDSPERGQASGSASAREGAAPSSPQWLWKHQLRPSLGVESELRYGQSEPRIPLATAIGWAWLTSPPMRALGKRS